MSTENNETTTPPLPVVASNATPIFDPYKHPVICTVVETPIDRLIAQAVSYRDTSIHHKSVTQPILYLLMKERGRQESENKAAVETSDEMSLNGNGEPPVKRKPGRPRKA